MLCRWELCFSQTPRRPSKLARVRPAPLYCAFAVPWTLGMQTGPPSPTQIDDHFIDTWLRDMSLWPVFCSRTFPVNVSCYTCHFPTSCLAIFKILNSDAIVNLLLLTFLKLLTASKFTGESVWLSPVDTADITSVCELLHSMTINFYKFLLFWEFLRCLLPFQKLSRFMASLASMLLELGLRRTAFRAAPALCVRINQLSHMHDILQKRINMY